MARYRGPITRLSRRLGVMLFTNGASKQKAYTKKNYRPGEHGAKRVAQVSEYGKRLLEKQKARFMYGITEKQSRKYYVLAQKSGEVTGIKYLQLLEQRLDNAMYRAGLAATRPQARQMVNHGLILLNGRRVKIPSILVKEGDTFEVHGSRKDSKLFEEVKQGKVKPPRWLSFDPKTLKGKVEFAPGSEDIENIIDHRLITEFYSK